MYNKKPPFEITGAILAEIAELVGQVNASQGLSARCSTCRHLRQIAFSSD